MACIIAAIFLCREFRGPGWLSPGNSAAYVSTAARSTSLTRPPLVVDLNHDNRPDTLIVVSEAHGGQTIKISLDGIGDRELRCGYHPGASSIVHTADVNGDANLDVIQVSVDGLEPATVWLGDGKGNFVLSAAAGSLGDDFYTLPAAPYRSPESPRPRSASLAASTAAEKRNHLRILKPHSAGTPQATTDTHQQLLDRKASAPFRRELLLWTARTINAPPSLLLIA
jgi:hypothetical protein